MEATSELRGVIRAWRNERMAPELLDYCEEEVKELLELVEWQEGAMQEHNSVEGGYIQKIKEMEVARVKYMLMDYMMTRLTKLERYAEYYFTNQDRLSGVERAYVEKYLDITRREQSEILKQVPAQVLAVETEGPELRKAVVASVVEDVGLVQLNEEAEPVEMRRGEKYITSYLNVRELVRLNKVELV